MIDVLNSFLIAFKEIPLFLDVVSMVVVCWLFCIVFRFISHNFNY